MAKDKFLLVSLKDQEAKQLAQVITNDTSRRILDYLTEREATETQLSQDLGIPLPTVHYNLKALQQARLVTVEQFHYSPKGREVNHYKLANKYIIIAPASTWGLKERLKSILPMIPIVGGAALALEWFARSTGPQAMTAPLAAPAFAPLPAPLQEAAVLAKSQAAQITSPQAALGQALPTLVQQAPPAPSLAAQAPPLPQPEAIRMVADQGLQAASPIWSHPGLWLLAGAVLVLLAWLIIEGIRARKSSRL